MFIDTHTHIYSEEFDADRTEMVQRAIDSGVEKMLLPAIDSFSFEAMWAIAKQFPNHISTMMGLHPCSVKEGFEKELELVQSELENPNQRYVAVGEIGIDLYWDKSTLDIQIEAFRQQLKWAKQYQLPVAIHIRNAFDEVFKTLEEEKTEDLKGVLHCFTGGKRHVVKARELGFYMGIGGVVTYPNSGIDHVLKRINLEEIVLETDAPYLAPNPHKGSRNEPSYLTHIATRVAEIKETSVQEIADITSANAKKLFNL